MQSRIREIRKSKGMTLQQVAARVGTTAQTVGRLETGMRTLSIKWINRIAEALECDPGELLALPEGGDIPVLGNVGADGSVKPGPSETIVWRADGSDTMAIRLTSNAGPFRAGDYLIFDQEIKSTKKLEVGRHCLVQHGKTQLLCKSTGSPKTGVVGYTVCGTSEYVSAEAVSSVRTGIRCVRDLTV